MGIYRSIFLCVLSVLSVLFCVTRVFFSCYWYFVVFIVTLGLLVPMGSYDSHGGIIPGSRSQVKIVLVANTAKSDNPNVGAIYPIHDGRSDSEIKGLLN